MLPLLLPPASQKGRAGAEPWPQAAPGEGAGRWGRMLCTQRRGAWSFPSASGWKAWGTESSVIASRAGKKKAKHKKQVRVTELGLKADLEPKAWVRGSGYTSLGLVGQHTYLSLFLDISS